MAPNITRYSPLWLNVAITTGLPGLFSPAAYTNKHPLGSFKSSFASGISIIYSGWAGVGLPKSVTGFFGLEPVSISNPAFFHASKPPFKMRTSSTPSCCNYTLSQSNWQLSPALYFSPLALPFTCSFLNQIQPPQRLAKLTTNANKTDTVIAPALVTPR